MKDSRTFACSDNFRHSINLFFDLKCRLQVHSKSFSLPLEDGLVLILRLLRQECLKDSARQENFEHQIGRLRLLSPLFYQTQGLPCSLISAQHSLFARCRSPLCGYVRSTGNADTTPFRSH